MRDFDAIGALILGLLVFGVLAVTPAWSAERYVEPSHEEFMCVNFISLFTVYRTVPAHRDTAADAIVEAGLGQLALEGLADIEDGTGAGYVLPVLYKRCLALKGQEVV